MARLYAMDSDDEDGEDDVQSVSDDNGDSSDIDVRRPLPDSDSDDDNDDEEEEEDDDGDGDDDDEDDEGVTGEFDDDDDDDDDDDNDSWSSFAAGDVEGEQSSHEDIPRADFESSRIAVMDLDWTHITSTDLFVLFTSFVPSTGAVVRVTVYPTEFGQARSCLFCGGVAGGVGAEGRWLGGASERERERAREPERDCTDGF